MTIWVRRYMYCVVGVVEMPLDYLRKGQWDLVDEEETLGMMHDLHIENDPSFPGGVVGGIDFIVFRLRKTIHECYTATS